MPHLSSRAEIGSSKLGAHLLCCPKLIQYAGLMTMVRSIEGRLRLMADDDVTRGNGAPSPRVNFDYIKGQHFRVIHTDGAIGGITPRGLIHMSLYSERQAIPRRTVSAIEDNKLGDEILTERVARDAVVRELDVDVIMTIDSAESLCVWLREKVTLAKQMIEMPKDEK